MLIVLRFLLMGVGYTFLIIGLFGLLMPLIPDWLLLIPAFAILGRKSWIGRAVYRRLPRPIRRKVFDPRMERLVRWLGKKR